MQKTHRKVGFLFPGFSQPDSLYLAAIYSEC